MDLRHLVLVRVHRDGTGRVAGSRWLQKLTNRMQKLNLLLLTPLLALPGWAEGVANTTVTQAADDVKATSDYIFPIFATISIMFLVWALLKRTARRVS